jgi:histidinol phosphatase-like PHP family hydrolase
MPVLTRILRAALSGIGSLPGTHRCEAVLSTDAHSTVELGFMRYAVDQARRGRLELGDVINTRDVAGHRQLLRR